MNVHFTKKERQSPDVSQGIRVPYAPARRVVAQWRWWFICTLVVSPFFYLLYKMFLPVLVVTAPGLITLEKETLTAVVDSAVERIHVKPGDRVHKGQVLAELIAPKLEEQIENLHDILEPLNSSTVAPGQTIIRQSMITLYRQQEQYATQAVTHQEQRLSIVSRLFSQGAATAAEVNTIRSQLDGARHTLIQAQLQRTDAEQQLLLPATGKLGKTPEPGQIQKQLASLESQRQQLILRAANDGTALEILAEQGKILAPGEGILVLGRQSQSRIIAYLKPEQVKLVTAGVRATVSVSGGPSLQAQVRENPSQAGRLPAEFSSAIGTRDIMVLVTLDPIEPLPVERAIEGLPVNVRFHDLW